MFACVAMWCSFKGLICEYECILFRFPLQPSLETTDSGLESLHGCLGVRGPGSGAQRRALFSALPACPWLRLWLLLSEGFTKLVPCAG